MHAKKCEKAILFRKVCVSLQGNIQSLIIKTIKDMALPIASIPVLTGEVAQRFEERAQANYQRYLNRTEEQKKADEAILEKKFAELYSMLSKAHLGRR